MLILENKHYGHVVMSNHAYQRAEKRIPKKYKVKLKERLIQSFWNAVPVDMKKGFAIHRMISNGYKPVLYLWDRGWNVRYVISENVHENSGLRTIITLENVNNSNSLCEIERVGREA